jgi:hypothetical protein
LKVRAFAGGFLAARAVTNAAIRVLVTIPLTGRYLTA